MVAAPKDHSDTLETVCAIKLDLGEGPVWDDRTGTLVFVDSNRGQIFRLLPNGSIVSTTEVGQVIGAAVPREAGGFAVSSGSGLLSVTEGTGEVEMLCPIEADLPGNRMNDAKCDAKGRLWSGTLATDLSPDAGALYRVDADLSLTRALAPVHVSNGLGWSPDNSRMYFVDTLSRGVDVFDFDLESGEISDRRTLVSFERGQGVPDGIAVDAEGCVWVALFYGGQVRRYSPKGEWTGTVRLPVARVTSCNFGGPDLDELYITTADYRMHEDGRPHEPDAGYVFRCRPGVRGLPSHRFAA